MDSHALTLVGTDSNSTTRSIGSHNDLIAYARKHRYRVRNLHDGGSVPPAIHTRGVRTRCGYVGEDDRWDAIVGRNGYLAMEGSDLAVVLFFKSAKGVNRATAKLRAMEGRIDQEGDTEVSAIIPPERIGDVLTLIKVSKLRPPNQGSFRPGTELAYAAESRE